MTTFRCLFDNPAIGDHSPLVLGWGEEQLGPIVDRLAPCLPDDLTVEMKLAIAGIARSIVTEEKITGNGVHFARGKEPYRMPKRYRDGDPHNTWHYTTRAMDTLASLGLIHQALGVRTAGDISRWRGRRGPWWPWLDRWSMCRSLGV